MTTPRASRPVSADIKVKLGTLKSDLEQLSFAALVHRILAQEDTINTLNNCVANLTDEVSKQEAAISKLKSSYQAMKQRALDVIKVEEPLAETLKAVANLLKTRTTRSNNEERVLSQVEYCSTLIATLQTVSTSARLTVDGRNSELDLFSEAPDEFVDKLATTMKMLVFQANENIISINDPADCMYFILQGVVQVIGGTGIVHAEMQTGTSFGEVGILLNMNRTASIRAKQECHVFQLTKGNLEKVVVIYPIMKEKLKTAADERFALFKLRTNGSKVAQQPDQFDIEVGEQSLAKLGIFSRVDLSIISELAAMLIRKTWKKGELILKCGDTGTSMFFLAAGNADVVSEFGELLESVSGPSAFFGEVSLLEAVPRIASVKCASICSTYELRKDDFNQIMKKYPDIAGLIKETADNRMQQYLMRNVLA
ncbi:UNVERIFIED_CONTAM: hypothetical protein HDU68_001563 [Siphonaria sp. JEL0065]|nr:hypothetical protein HDU68_001563 [Siphonaria sp. JEL0065]